MTDVTKIDPADGLAYTLSELQAKYKGTYSEAEVDNYFKVTCREDEKRIDPADQKGYTWSEMEAKYNGQYSAAELNSYWVQSCKKVEASTGLATSAAGAATAPAAAPAQTGTATGGYSSAASQPATAARPRPGGSYSSQGVSAVRAGGGRAGQPQPHRTYQGATEKVPFPTEEEQKLANKREDPTDHKFYTWEECQEKYKGQHSEEDVFHWYWHKMQWCENKIDPDDNKVYALMELHAKYTTPGFYSGNDTLNYFKEQCLPCADRDEPPPKARYVKVPPGWKPPGQRKEDPDDRKTYNWDQIQQKYKGKYPADELKKYWEKDCRWVETKIDPDDRLGYTLMEMHAKYTTPGFFPAGETVKYFQNDCTELDKWLSDYAKKEPYTQEGFELPPDTAWR